MTKEQLGNLILDSERQLYSTAKTILFSDQDCADAIQETIVKAFSKIDTLKNDKYKVYGELLTTYGYSIEPGAKKFDTINFILMSQYQFRLTLLFHQLKMRKNSLTNMQN